MTTCLCYHVGNSRICMNNNSGSILSALQGWGGCLFGALRGIMMAFMQIGEGVSPQELGALADSLNVHTCRTEYDIETPSHYGGALCWFVGFGSKLSIM